MFLISYKKLFLEWQIPYKASITIITNSEKDKVHIAVTFINRHNTASPMVATCGAQRIVQSPALNFVSAAILFDHGTLP